MSDKYEAPYSVSKMTGCSHGKVPTISLEEALSSGEMVKAVELGQSYPLYASVSAIDYGSHSFEMTDNTGIVIYNLPWVNYKIFKAEPIDSKIPKDLGSSIICDKEIFTVVSDNPVPVWVGDKNFVYYCEDIQALTKKYGYEVLWI